MPSRSRLQFDHVLRAPQTTVFAFLTEHWDALWPGRFVVEQAGADGAPYGDRSIRAVRSAGITILREQVTTCTPELIEYKVIGRAPIKEHLGRVRLSEHADGTRFEYAIGFEGAFPLVGPAIAACLGSIWRRYSAPRLERALSDVI